MIEIPRPMLAVYAAAALVVALIGARYLQLNSAASAPPKSSAVVHVGSAAAGATGGGSAGGLQRGPLVVHVTGAVRRPGLVDVDNGDRVGTAIKRAGGPTRDADLTAVNLAMRVADGQQIVVPARAAAGRGGGELGVSGTGAAVSLNTATVEQLDTLDGVGPGLAAKIIAARTQKGGFGTVDDLADVPGIGEKRLESLRSQLQP